MSSKKWYNLFVVRTPGDAAAETAAAPERVADIAAAADSPGEDAFSRRRRPTPTDMADIYGSAQIGVPAHGYTVLKVAEMLQSEHIRALPADVKRKSIMVALDAAGVKVDDIVEDAVQRDRALDTYERVLQKHLDELRAAEGGREPATRGRDQPARRRAAARIDENNADSPAEQNNLLAWRVAQAPGRGSHCRGGRLFRLGESDHDVRPRRRQGRLQCSLGWAGCSGPGWVSSSRWVKTPK